ncbi:hypothetical protein Btru_021725 [Bulinus truncatus]|nr:hypothetical protein Btru_021725 [Bulinus truncatus]
MYVTDRLINEAVYDEAIYSEAVYSEAVYSEAVQSEAVYSEAVYGEAVYSKAVYNEAVYNEAVYSEAVYSEAVEAVYSEAVYGEAVYSQAVYSVHSIPLLKFYFPLLNYYYSSVLQIYFTMNPYYRRRVKCLTCWKTVASPATKTTTGGKFTEECPGERSSDQITQLPISTYITPSPSVPHCVHTTLGSDALNRGSVSNSSVVPISDDDSNNDAAILDDGQAEIRGVNFNDLSKNNLRNMILTLEKGSQADKGSQDRCRKNDLLNDDIPNNVSKSGVKSASRIKFILDTRNFQRIHRETLTKKPEVDYITYNDLGSANRISHVENSVFGAKLSFQSNNSNLSANMGNFDDAVEGRGSPVREKAVKRLVGVALTTQGKGEITLNTNVQGYSQSEPLESDYLPCKEDARTYVVQDKNRWVNCLGIRNKLDTTTDHNENVESFVCMCPRDVDHMFGEDRPFISEYPTSV